MANEHHHGIDAVIAQQISEAVSQQIKSPVVQNQIIGAALKHAGLTLAQASSSYESLTPDRILVKPELMKGEDHTAVILMNSFVYTKNAYQLLATAREVDQGAGVLALDFTVTIFVPDPVVTSNTQFFNVSEAMQQEILRQLGVICNKPGSYMFGMVTINNFFPAVGIPKEHASNGGGGAATVADTVQQAQESVGAALPDVEML